MLTLITLETRKQTSAKSSFPSVEQPILTTPGFIESLTSRLASSNVQVIHAALQLINSILLCLVLPTQGNGSPLFESLREAGLLRNASVLFENKPLAASCSPQLYDLQELIRSIFCQYQHVPIDLSNPHHSNSFKQSEAMLAVLIGSNQSGAIDWHRIGLNDGQDPIGEFNSSLMWAGLQDFVDFLALDDISFKKMYLEHLAFSPPNSRFPLVNASLAVSEIMSSIFGVREHQLSSDYFNETPESFIPPSYITPTPSSPTSTSTDQFGYSTGKNATSSMLSPTTSASETVASSAASRLKLGNSTSVESELAKLGKLRPLMFDWTLLHCSGIVNFLRLWLTSSAQHEDFENIVEVVRILFAQAIPKGDFSTISIDAVINKLDTFSYADIRAVQLQNIEEDLNSEWGLEIRSLHNQFQQESFDFVKEQRIRLLLRGEWFYVDNPTQPPPAAASARSTGQRLNGASTASVAAPTSRRYFVALSPSLNTIHYSEYPSRVDEHPSVENLSRSVDLGIVSKVVVTSLTTSTQGHQRKNRLRVNLASRTNYSKISLIFNGARDGSSLTFYTDTPEKAAAWGDGLLMLKNKSYQSTETKKYIDMFAETKLRLQMMHITPGDLAYARQNPPKNAPVDSDLVVTTEDFYYA